MNSSNNNNNNNASTSNNIDRNISNNGNECPTITFQLVFYMGSDRCSLTLLCLQASMPVFTLKTVLMECFRGAHGPMKPLSSSKLCPASLLTGLE